MNNIYNKIRPYLLPSLLALCVLIAVLNPAEKNLPFAAKKIEKAIADWQNDFDKIQDINIGDAHSLLYFVYNANDSLLSYTDNSVAPPSPEETESAPRIYHARNGWYFLQTKKVGSKTIIALALIKNDFRFENKFLRNGFSPALRLPENFTISEVELKGALSIRTREGKTIFWLYNDATKTDRTGNHLLAIVYIILLVIVAYYIHQAALFTIKKHGRIIGTCTLIISVFWLRFIMIYLKFPAPLYALEIFDPSLYGTAYFAESLGDLLISCLTVFWVVVFYTRQNPRCTLFSFPKRYQLLEIILLFVLQYIAVGCILWLVKSMVIDSVISFEVYNVLSLSFYSIIGLSCLGILLICHFLLSINALRRLIDLQITTRQILAGSVVVSCVFVLVFFYLPYKEVLLFTTLWCWTFAWVGYRLFIKYDHVQEPRKLFIFVLLYSVLSMFLIENLYERKERTQREFFAGKLASGHDYVAEFTFRDIAARMLADRYIRSFFYNPIASKRDLQDRIVSLYFSGYFNKYDLQVRTFNALGQPLQSNDSLYLTAAEKNRKTATLLYQCDSTGSNSYEALLDIKDDSMRIGWIALRFVPKLYNGQNVYPELLLNQTVSNTAQQKDFDFAIYQNEKLTVQHGDFPYSYYWDHSFSPEDSAQQHFFETQDWEHLVCKFANGRKVIVSVRQEGFFEPLATISYFYVLYIVLISLILLAYNLYTWSRSKNSLDDEFSISFRARINYAMLFIIAISFIVIGLVTVSFFRSQYDTFYTDRLVRKEKAILADIEYYLQENTDLTQTNSLTHTQLEELLNVELAKLSAIHNIDINVYDLQGNVATSSQPAIFENGLVSKKIHPRAYYRLVEMRDAQYAQQEQIGSLTYTATYAPIRSLKGRTLAFLAVPYFEKSKSINSEVSSFLVALINAYVFLLLCAAVLAYSISNSITRPLRFISEKFRLLNLTKRNEPIEWKSKDELGVLIAEYNKMIEQLESSASMLAKSERESAWREMARQIAHEIKNPLTPMKLSIQYLQRAIDEDNPNVPDLARKVSKTLIEQIEHLNSIATAFSSFAQMPKSNNERLELNDLLRGIISLFEKEGHNVTINFSSYKEEAYVFADKNQLISVFNNLIKNAMQAVPEGRTGEITVITLEEYGNIKTVVMDNGVGIAPSAYEKVFAPNFTTKSSGTGLGLAIAKQIVENAKGQIWFESEENSGTTFYVTLPYYAE